jgi:hypothetical protein
LKMSNITPKTRWSSQREFSLLELIVFPSLGPKTK